MAWFPKQTLPFPALFIIGQSYNNLALGIVQLRPLTSIVRLALALWFHFIAISFVPVIMVVTSLVIVPTNVLEGVPFFCYYGSEKMVRRPFLRYKA